MKLKIRSTASMAQAAQDETQLGKLVETTSPQLVYDTWRTSAKREIRHNCSLTLAYMFTRVVVPNDDMLGPVLSICNAEAEIETRLSCMSALLRR
jgi:hypothetical protein